MTIFKIGGGQKINLNYIVEDLKNLKDPFIIVHGGNYYLDYYSQKLNIEKKMLTSPTGLTSRYTTKETIELMYMTYAGLMNKKIVESFRKSGLNAIGLSGLDARLITGKKHPSLLIIENGKKKVVSDDLTGSVQEINTGFLKYLLSQKMIPVITPPVMTTDNEVINVDGDKIASKIALSLKAETLMFLIEATGLLADFQNKNSLLTRINKKEIEKLLPTLTGRVKRKVMECAKLLDSGIEKIIISDGTIENPVTNALKGGGTHVV